jgi:outer membrane protein OmpA-like peptidoglycan-associated protein
MKSNSVVLTLLIGVCWLQVAYGPAAAAGEKDEVNKFYTSVVDTLKRPSHLSSLVALVEKNPGLAEKCCPVLDKKAQVPGKQGAALRMVYDKLHVAILLASKPSKCDGRYFEQVVKAAGSQIEEDDRIFCLEKVVGFCPRTGPAWIALGDLYLEQRRCGMAAAAYQKAVELTGDGDCRKLLEEARTCQEDYVKQKPLRYANVLDLVFKDRKMAPERNIHRKARIGNSIQRQILFDEWSYQIKEQFKPELKVIGEALKEELSKNTNAGVRLLIEGHTDKRGPLDRNMQLSKDRAQAIKDHLVQNYGIDSSQLVTEGFGPTRPYSPEENETGWSLNRRVEFKKLN